MFSVRRGILFLCIPLLRARCAREKLNGPSYIAIQQTPSFAPPIPQVCPPAIIAVAVSIGAWFSSHLYASGGWL